MMSKTRRTNLFCLAKTELSPFFFLFFVTRLLIAGCRSRAIVCLLLLVILRHLIFGSYRYPITSINTSGNVCICVRCWHYLLCKKMISLTVICIHLSISVSLSVDINLCFYLSMPTLCIYQYQFRSLSNQHQ